MWKRLFGKKKVEVSPIKNDEKASNSKFDDAIREKMEVIKEKYPEVNKDNVQDMVQDVTKAVMQTIGTHGIPLFSEESIRKSEERNKFVQEKNNHVSGKRDESNKYLKEFRKTKQPYNDEYVYHTLREFVYGWAFWILGTPANGSFFNYKKSYLAGEYSLFENTIFKNKYDQNINKEQAKVVEIEVYKFCFVELPELMQLPKLPSGEFMTLNNRNELSVSEVFEIKEWYDLLPFSIDDQIGEKLLQWTKRIVIE